MFISQADVVYTSSSYGEKFLEVLSKNGADISNLGFTNQREDLSVAVRGTACQLY